METSILIGYDVQAPDFSFSNEDIISVVTETSVSMSMDELTADVAEIEVHYVELDGELQGVTWGTPVFIYYGEELQGKFYIRKITRVGKHSFKLDAISAIGLLDYETFYGGLYTGEAFEDVARQIILTNGFDFRGYSTGLHRGLIGDMTYSGSAATNFGALPYTQNDVMFDDFSDLIFDAEFKLNKCILNDLPEDPFPSQTSVRLYLLGSFPSDSLKSKTSANAVALKKHSCGLYMDVTRANTSSPWPDYGTVYFGFETSAWSLGTPTQPTTYTISVDAENLRATVNGTTYNLTFTETSPLWTCYAFAQYYGAGVTFDLNAAGTDRTVQTPQLYCDVEYNSYRVQTPATVREPIVKITMSGNLYPYDVKTGHDITQSFGWAEVGGDFYEIQTQQAYQVEICENADFSNVGGVTVRGYIPICTKREALHQLMFASGVSILKDDAGNLMFTGLSGYTDDIDSSKIYNDGSVEPIEQVNALQLTEKTYYYDSTVDTETLYDSESAPDNKPFYVIFPVAPVNFNPNYRDLEHIVLFAYNCNACIIAGYGNIYARPYKITEKTITRIIGNHPDGRTITVEDCGLIGQLNSEAILDRLEAYYKSESVATIGLVSDEEKSGFKYNFRNAFGEVASGYLNKVSAVFAGIIKKTCEFIVGYRPVSPGNSYSNFVVLSGSGTWDVPEEVFEKSTPKIKIVVIGGGTGGGSGLAGNSGNTVSVGSSTATAADGGLGGTSGSGGKVYEVTITDPPSQYTYSCGTGGEGGAICTSTETPNEGSAGTDTTITGGGVTYSSASGSTSESGYINPLNGKAYAKSWTILYWNEVVIQLFGQKYGVGMGGSGGTFYEVLSRFALLPGTRAIGIDNVEYSGGSNGKNYPTSGSTVNATGGTGGGGAVGGTAGNGTDASYSGGKYRAGNGGKGADAVGIPPKATTYNSDFYGYGGHGGYGGGGGGCSGYAQSQNGVAGTGGVGGYGGKGGTGGDGCVLIFY